MAGESRPTDSSAPPLYVWGIALLICALLGLLLLLAFLLLDDPLSYLARVVVPKLSSPAS